MKKRALSFALAVCMICLLTMTSCSASDAPVNRRTGAENVTLTSPAQEISGFSDVPASADYAEAVAWCQENSILNGVGGGRFDPEGSLTRTMLVTALYRAEGEPAVSGMPAFTDTQAGTWYSNAVVWAENEGLVRGYGDGRFGTDDPVSVEQTEVILGRYMGDGPEWVGDPSKAAAATRAQVAAALYHAMKDGREPPVRETGKVLVAYFSCTNTTKGIAERIASGTDGTLYAIEAADPYTVEDLKYYTNGRADREQADPDCRPAIAGEVADMEQYDTVFLGYPIWHGQAPRIISTFLERYDFSGKTLIPFCTSHSSGIGSSDTSLHPLTSDTTTWKPGKRFSGNEGQGELSQWIAGLDLSIQNAETPSVAVFDLASGVNGSAPTVTLSSGYEMPVAGIGTYSLKGEECVDSIKSALEQGVRLIDTAYMYGNEREVGQAVREFMAESGTPREEIFVITKLYPGEQFSNPEKAIQDALDKLDVGYIDMMLLHHPGANDVSAYKAMEQAVADGKIRSLGLSNWYIEEIDAFIAQVDIKPALVQNEIHPYYQEQEVIPYMHDLGIVMQAWYPLGGRGHQTELLSDDTLTEIAQAHGVSVAQVILRWDLQNGVVVIPGSSNPDHILENISLFDFELTGEEMSAIAALDRGEKHDWY